MGVSLNFSHKTQYYSMIFYLRRLHKMANKQTFENMKYEVAKEVGVPLKQGYNGDITSREAGKIGGTIVQKVFEQYKNQQ